MQDASLNRLLIARAVLGHMGYEHTDEHGAIRLWDVTEGNKIASSGHQRMVFSLEELGMTEEKIHECYRGIDEEYALTTDLTKPLLFIPFFQCCLLIDGWHRAFHAAHKRVDE